MTDTPMSSWGRLSSRRSVVGVAGELVAVLAVIGFAGSIILNTLVFRHWRLNFIQIASSSDVLTTGFDGSLKFALIAIAIMAPSAIVYCARLYRLVPPRHRSFAIMACLVISLILMIVLVGFISRAFLAQGIGIYWRVLIIAAIDGGIAMAAVLQFLLIDAESRRDFGERRLFWGLDSRWVSSPYPVVILVMIVVSGLQELGAVVTMYETSGYLGTTHYMSSPPPGCDGKVLWIGERALVITCSRDRLQHYAVVGTLNAPNLVICEFPVSDGHVGCSALPAAPRAAPPLAVVTPPPAAAAPPRQASLDAPSTTRRLRPRPRPTPQALESSASPVGGVGVEASSP
ncbi:MAG TPA: hypothetical protein VK801_06920 [Caulobacteraceae bacterium]|jgi:hypothetical protein|nr:hypothetical protein [Caulobacteraceae bacterium]